jgi:hypothetical protein
MANSEKSSSRSGLGWLPKLILWAAVIGFGYVYLSSVDREGGAPSASALLESVAKLSPIPISALPGFGDSESVPESAPEVAKSEEEAAPKGDSPKPVGAAESAAFAKSLIEEKVDTAKSAPAEAPKPAPVREPATYAAVAAQKPVAEPTRTAPAQAPAAEAPVQPSAPPATVEAPVSAPMPQPFVASPRMPAPAPSASESGAPTAGLDRAAGWESMRQQRADMVAQYEAMRREADERMRQYWERMRQTMPMAAPYGYPAYGPAYAPGYMPGVYGPAR